jgi:formylglycine-generating enzyme required for sulfatase activity
VVFRPPSAGEAQWEFAARGGLRDRAFSWGNTWRPCLATTWQGEFPVHNRAEDGFSGTAPVGLFPPNGSGQQDMGGHVWEWTEDGYRPGHDRLAGRDDPLLADSAASSDPREPGVAKHVF